MYNSTGDSENIPHDRTKERIQSVNSFSVWTLCNAKNKIKNIKFRGQDGFLS